MSNDVREPFEIICPCCQTRLRVDADSKAILSHEPPPEERTITNLEQAMMGLKAEAAQRQAKFEESMKQEKGKKDLLDKKFQDALKRTKDAPITRPIRDIDLD